MEKLSKLVEVCRWMSMNHYSPATSGNYSLRIDDLHFYVSASGIEKGQIVEEDFIKMKLDGSYDDQRKPSDEALIHAKIYELDKNAHCVLHSHSIASTTVSLFTKEDFIVFEGIEMQKAFVSIKSHEDKMTLKSFNNSQNMKDFSIMLQENFDVDSNVPCFVIKGHGIYVWGPSIQVAKRHLEGIEFLMAVKLELLKLGSK